VTIDCSERVAADDYSVRGAKHQFRYFCSRFTLDARCGSRCSGAHRRSGKSETMIDCFRNSTIFVIYPPNSAVIARLSGRRINMGMDTKDMTNEMGAAFAVTWLVMGCTAYTFGDDGAITGTEFLGTGMSGIMAIAALGVAWMAFAGAHILPPVTWMHIMTGDLGDADAWMANGTKLVMQIIGGALALIMMAEMHEGPSYADGVAVNGAPEWAFDAMVFAGGLAAGAILWCIHSKAGNVWATAVGVVVLGGYIGATGSTDMASMLMNDMGDLVPVLLDWIVTGVSVGLGALVATKIDENL